MPPRPTTKSASRAGRLHRRSVRDDDQRPCALDSGAEVDRIRNAAEAAARSTDPIDEIQADIDVLMDELDGVLEDELVASGNAGNVSRFTETERAA